MIKTSKYDGRDIMSMDVEGNPHADMRGILNLAIPGAWKDYEQVLNSDSDIQQDLNIKNIDGDYVIPVQLVSAWLYSFSLRNMRTELYDRFRVFRRDLESVLRVTWGLPVHQLVLQEPYIEFQDWGNGNTAYDLSSIFSSFDIPDDQLSGCEDIETPLEYIEYVAGGTACGPRGDMLCDMIMYIESMPCGDKIVNSINDALMATLPNQPEYLDDFLDTLNTSISHMASLFVGEY